MVNVLLNISPFLGRTFFSPSLIFLCFSISLRLTFSLSLSVTLSLISLSIYLSVWFLSVRLSLSLHFSLRFPLSLYLFLCSFLYICLSLSIFSLCFCNLKEGKIKENHKLTNVRNINLWVSANDIIFKIKLKYSPPNNILHLLNISLTQLTFTCSKSTIETREKGVKNVQCQQLKHQNDVIDLNCSYAETSKC